MSVELWATFDYYRENWERNPFNPKNNVNYTAAASGLPLAVPSHPARAENDFFRTIPGAKNVPVVLKYQQRFVDKALSCTLAHEHVLYVIDNETAATPKWGAYWAEHVRQAAQRQGRKVAVSEMFDPHDLTDPLYNSVIDHGELYDFVEIAQNNHQQGQLHYDRILGVRSRLAAAPWPMTNVKIYGAGGGRFGSDQDGMQRFWRNIFAGCASSRFHEKHLGGSETAARMILRRPHRYRRLRPLPYRAARRTAAGARAERGLLPGGCRAKSTPSISPRAARCDSTPAASKAPARPAGTISAAGAGAARTASHLESPSSWQRRAPANGPCLFKPFRRKAFMLTTTDVLIILASIALVVGVGVFAGRKKADTAHGYFLGGNRMPWWLIGTAFVATGISSEQMIGTVGATYQYGMGIANWEWFGLPCYALVLTIFIPIYLKNRVTTVPGFLADRFGPACGTIYSCMLLVFCACIYTVTVLYSGAWRFPRSPIAGISILSWH